MTLSTLPSFILLTLAATLAQTFSTDFESPTFAAGAPAVFKDGWGPGTGCVRSQFPPFRGPITVSQPAQSITNVTAGGGSQSLMWDNTLRKSGVFATGDLGSYSIGHSIGLSNGAAYTVSTKIRIDKSTTPGRYYGIYLSGGTFSLHNSTYQTFGVTIDGRGMIGIGPYGSSYQDIAVPSGNFMDRWLTVSLFFYGDGRAMVQVTGFANGSYRQSWGWSVTPASYTSLNLGTSYANIAVGGKGYFDDVNVQNGIVGALPALAP